MKRIGYNIAIYVFLLLLLSGCGTESKSRLNCVCLIDYSGSLSQETLNSYVTIITETIFKNLNETDRLIVIPIDEGAKTQAIKIVYEDLSSMIFSKPEDGFTHKQDSIVKRIHNYVNENLSDLLSDLKNQKELRRRFTNRTDIFSALEQVQTLLEKPKKENIWNKTWNFILGETQYISDNAIIIFSDMIHESQDCDFSNFSDGSTSRFDDALKSLVLKNRIPDFKSCSIFVDGRTGRSNAQVENIKKFWVEYFKLSSGDLISYDYDCSKEIELFLQKRRALNK